MGMLFTLREAEVMGPEDVERLVHLHTDIDHEVIYRIVQEDPGGLEASAVGIGELCREEN